MPTSTSLVTNLPADFNTFGQGVDTSMAQLKGGTTGQVLSKTSGTDMAFTWVTPTDQTPLTTKGDLFAFSTVDARLAVGANETRLVADSTQTVGLKYVADTTNYAINAKGDLLGGTAADTLQALSVGTNGQILVADSTASTGLKWAAPAAPTAVACSVYNAGGNVTYVANVPLIQNFTTENFDTNSMHDNSTNTSRITIPTGYAGKYLITGYARLNASLGYSLLRVYQNGSAVTAGLESGELVRGYHAGNTTGINGSVVLNLAVGDYIELLIQQDTSATIATWCRFAVSYLGA
jgi:hypothetical protein